MTLEEAKLLKAGEVLADHTGACHVFVEHAEGDEIVILLNSSSTRVKVQWIDMTRCEVDLKRRGYDDATVGNGLRKFDSEYLSGYEMGLESRIEWAQNGLAAFKAQLELLKPSPDTKD